MDNNETEEERRNALLYTGCGMALLGGIGVERLLKQGVNLNFDTRYLFFILGLRWRNQYQFAYCRMELLHTNDNWIIMFANANTRVRRPSIWVLINEIVVPPSVLGNCAIASFFWTTNSDALAMFGTMPLIMTTTLSASLSDKLWMS